MEWSLFYTSLERMCVCARAHVLAQQPVRAHVARVCKLPFIRLPGSVEAKKRKTALETGKGLIGDLAPLKLLYQAGTSLCFPFLQPPGLDRKLQAQDSLAPA